MSTFKFLASVNSVKPVKQNLKVIKMSESVGWCGMDACFDLSRCGDRQREEVCEDYTMGDCEDFETKKRKRDDADDDEEED